MKRLLPAILFLLTGLTVFVATASAAETGKTEASSADAEAKYTRAIEGRARGILDVLGLTDPAKEARVHDAIIAQYRALRAWDAANDAQLKKLEKDARGKNPAVAEAAKARIAEIKASLKALHNEYIAKLSADLTPAQVEKVKDKMTYNTVEATYNAYCEIVPNLTESDKARILELLKEGREEAMDGGSARAKALIFKKYKGKINNYLNAHGHDVGKAYKEWGKKQKEKAAAAAQDK